ncbi:hypothetical protein [Rothia sp. P4278]|uniref:hypothetical protein n=1 Tax=Rothia sp. P4278 TaxID=3402658 RepID=UPI003AE4A801
MSLEAFNLKSTVIISAEDAADFLAKMDISIVDINAGLEAGEQAAGNTGIDAPATAAGTRRWFDTTEVIRRELRTKGPWKIENPKNRPLVVHLGGDYRMGILGGDANTGIPDPDVVPKANRKKGVATKESVNANQEALFYLNKPADNTLHEVIGSLPPAGHWFLLYYRDEEEIRCEISLPSPSFEDGQFQSWQCRVILPPIDKTAVDRNKIPDIGGGDVEFQIA